MQKQRNVTFESATSLTARTVVSAGMWTRVGF